MTTKLNLASIKPSLDKLQALERELAASLIERDEVIRATLVALLARRGLVVLGPPGTASRLLLQNSLSASARRTAPGCVAEFERNNDKLNTPIPGLFY